jgi:hypothetical protein
MIDGHDHHQGRRSLALGVLDEVPVPVLGESDVCRL